MDLKLVLEGRGGERKEVVFFIVIDDILVSDMGGGSTKSYFS